MKRKYIPQPRSRFLKVTCECGNVQEVFSHASKKVNCRVCNSPLLKPRSGIAHILGEVIEVLDRR